MMASSPFAPPAAGAVAVGMGRLTLDVIVREGVPARSQGGGTCGNVLTNLAYLGWRSLPLTDLGDDDPGRRYAADLTRWGVGSLARTRGTTTCRRRESCAPPRSAETTAPDVRPNLGGYVAIVLLVVYGQRPCRRASRAALSIPE